MWILRWGGGVLVAPFKDEADENWYPILGQNLKNETQFKGKTKPKNLMETLLKSLSYYSNVKFSLNRWFVSCVAGHLRIWIAANTTVITVPYLTNAPRIQRQEGQN